MLPDPKRQNGCSYLDSVSCEGLGGSRIHPLEFLDVDVRLLHVTEGGMKKGVYEVAVGDPLPRPGEQLIQKLLNAQLPPLGHRHHLLPTYVPSHLRQTAKKRGTRGLI